MSTKPIEIAGMAGAISREAIGIVEDKGNGTGYAGKA